MKFNPYIIISAEKAGLSQAENNLRTDMLRRELQAQGIPGIQLKGRYNGSNEVSFLVPAAEDSPESHAVERLAKHWQQESVLAIDPDKRATLLFSDGTRKPLGPFREIDPAQEVDSYTDFPNGRRFAA